MRKNERKPGDQFTTMLCEECGEYYEADRRHICKTENSYPDRTLPLYDEENNELFDERIIIELESAISDYKDGAIIEVHDTLIRIIDAIDSFDAFAEGN